MSHWIFPSIIADDDIYMYIDCAPDNYIILYISTCAFSLSKKNKINPAKRL